MTTAITPIDSFRSTLTRMQPEFAAALPPQIPVERFIRTVVTVVQMNPKFLDADRRSLLGACMKAAQDGLLLDGREAALVPFGGKGGVALTYMPMIGGILKKLRNSGELLSISANVVYEADAFDYALGDDERIIHKPSLEEDRGSPAAVYAIAKTKDGGIYREVMSVGQVEAIRKRSRSGQAGPWVTDWSEMARKTVIRRLAKRLPSSTDLDRVLDSDNEATGIGPDAAGSVRIDAEPQGALPEAPAQERPTSRLRRSMAAKAVKVADAEQQQPELIAVTPEDTTEEAASNE